MKEDTLAEIFDYQYIDMFKAKYKLTNDEVLKQMLGWIEYNYIHL